MDDDIYYTSDIDEIMETAENLMSLSNTSNKKITSMIDRLQDISEEISEIEFKNDRCREVLNEAVGINRQLCEFFVYLSSLFYNIGTTTKGLVQYAYDHSRLISELVSDYDNLVKDVEAIKSKPYGFAIITGGSNHEDNIPGRNEPHASTTGKSDQCIQEDSPQ